MKLNPYHLKIGGVDSPGVSVTGIGKTAPANFLQIFNQVLKSVKELAQRIVFSGKGGDNLSARLPSTASGMKNINGAGKSNQNDEFLNLPAASVMQVPLERLDIQGKNKTDIPLSPERMVDPAQKAESFPAEQKELLQTVSSRNTGAQNRTVPPELVEKPISTRDDLPEAEGGKNSSGRVESIAGTTQAGLVEGNSAENTRLAGNTQILSPASGNSEVTEQWDSGYNSAQKQRIADLATDSGNLSEPEFRSKSSGIRSSEQTSVHTADLPSAPETTENYGKLRRIITRIFSRRQVGNEQIMADGSGKTDKISTDQLIRENRPIASEEATVNISARDSLLSGRAGRILSVESRILSKSGSDSRLVKSHTGDQNSKSFEESGRLAEVMDTGRNLPDAESHSRDGQNAAFQGMSDTARNFKSGMKKAGIVAKSDGGQENDSPVKNAGYDKGKTEIGKSGGSTIAAVKSGEIAHTHPIREKAPIVPEKPPATDEFPEQIARSAINRAAADAENIRVPETITRVSLIQKVTQFIEQSTRSGIKRQFSLQMKTEDNELVEMRFVRENRQNRGKIWVSSESMAQHLQRNLSVIQDNLLQKGIQFAELTVQLHNSDDFRSGEKNMNSRRANKKEERNLRTVESKQQQATVRTAYKYGYNTVEFIA